MHGAYVGGAVGRGWAVNSKPYRGNKVLSFRGQRCGVWGLQIRFGFLHVLVEFVSWNSDNEGWKTQVNTTPTHEVTVVPNMPVGKVFSISITSLYTKGL